MAFGRGTINKVILLGRLGADPELKYTPAGTAVANFNLATNQVWKDSEGNQQERTEWHRIVVWRKTAEFAGEWLKKGSLVFVEGRLVTRTWDDKNGVKHYMTEVVADSVELVGAKREGSGSTETYEPPTPQEPPPVAEDNEDDLPF